MTTLNQVLKEILLISDSVTVPGFGIFDSSYKPAQIDEKNKTINPPTKLTKFTYAPTCEGTDLVNYLVKNLSLSETDAQKLISDFIAITIEKFKLKANVVIEEVGILYKSESDEVLLKTIPSNILIESYGLSNAPLPKINKNAKKDGKKIASAQKNMGEVNADNKPQSKKKVVKTMLLLLPLVAVITLSILYWSHIKDFSLQLVSKYWNKNLLTDSVKTDLSDTLKTDINTDTNNYTTVSDSDQEILSQAGFSDVQPINLGAQYKKYYLIIGSFENKEYAQKRMKELKSKNINCSFLAESSPYRLVAGEADTAPEIVQQFKNLSQTNNKIDLWLLINK